jgi:hypothetical protein
MEIGEAEMLRSKINTGFLSQPGNDSDQLQWDGAFSGSSATAPAPISALAPDFSSLDTVAPLAPSPTATFSWAGVTQAVAGGRPPDLNIAAGPNAIVAVVNNHIDIYNKTGVQTLSSQTFNDFFKLPITNAVFDPQVTWDQYIGRFIVVEDDRGASSPDQPGSTSVLHIAVSKTSDPTQGWFTFDYNVKIDNNWLDRPILGVDSTTLYVSSNYFGLSTGTPNLGGMLWAFDANALAAGNMAPGKSFTSTGLMFPGGAFSAFAPAHTYGSKSGFSGDFLVNYNQNAIGADDFLNIVQVSNALGTPIINSQSLNVGNISNADPSGARQMGSSTKIDDGDNRIANAVWSNDKLYAVTEIRTPDGTHDVVHWFVVDTSNLTSLKLLSQGNIDYGAGFDTYYGNLTVDNAGNMIIGYSFSGPTAFAGGRYAVIPPGGTGLSAGDNGVDFAPGLGAYSSTATNDNPQPNPQLGNFRWGDYSGVAIDPANNGSFYVFNEFANTPTADSNWASQIAGVHKPSLLALPVTATDLTVLQQGVQASTNPAEATTVATQIDNVPAVGGQTVFSYATQLLNANAAFTVDIMATDSLMQGGTPTAGPLLMPTSPANELQNLAVSYLPNQAKFAQTLGLNVIVFDASAVALGVGAGGDGTQNNFLKTFGSPALTVSDFFTTVSGLTNVNTAFLQAQYNGYVDLYNKALPAGYNNADDAARAATFGVAVGTDIANPTLNAKLISQVNNALILNAESLIGDVTGAAVYKAGIALASEPTALPLQGTPPGGTSSPVAVLGVSADLSHSV